ncbi:Sugar transport protein 14 [Hibiscus syriacus]|uniref:Sugar transport protein 14 n=1 Tax=Hibiscus syriacus TaxID=106335 RepID=A0A6A2XIE0_HIBSY|nr:Sugar transport protein 14 [Hibiscus syriacus]
MQRGAGAREVILACMQACSGEQEHVKLSWLHVHAWSREAGDAGATYKVAGTTWRPTRSPGLHGDLQGRPDCMATSPLAGSFAWRPLHWLARLHGDLTSYNTAWRPLHWLVARIWLVWLVCHSYVSRMSPGLHGVLQEFSFCFFSLLFTAFSSMAGGGFGNEGGSLRRAHLYEYKITNYFIFACLVVATGGSLFGYDLGVSGGVTSMDDFLKDFFPKIYKRKQEHLHETDYCKYDNQFLTLFTSSLYFAGLVSTFGASYVTRQKGRRASILVGAVSFFLGGVINAAAMNIGMLIIGRILLGAGIGFGNQAVPLYLSEMAPAKHRGAVNQLFQFTTCMGIPIANLINYKTDKIHPWGWRFRGTPNVEAEFADLIEASEAAREIKHPFRNLLKRKNRPQLVLGAIGIPAFQQLTGMNSILFYPPVMFQTLGFGSGASLISSVLTSGMLVVATLVSMALVDRFGRRAFFLEAGTEMFCYMIAVAVTLAIKFGEGEELPQAIGWFLVLIICLFVFAYGRSWGPLGWLVPSELFPLETRSAGQSMVLHFLPIAGNKQSEFRSRKSIFSGRTIGSGRDMSKMKTEWIANRQCNTV